MFYNEEHLKIETSTDFDGLWGVTVRGLSAIYTKFYPFIFSVSTAIEDRFLSLFKKKILF